jgi:type II secretory pathway pseudopilin PulG
MNIKNLKFKIRNPVVIAPLVLRPSPSASRVPSSGFTYMALLAAIIIIGISLGAVTRYLSNISLREKEEELLFRGDQYRKAIQSYTSAIPGRTEFPQSIDDLLRDSRTATMRRHLRQKFKDPISGEDFVEIRDPVTRRITGVNSPSDKEPLKQADFPEEDKDFEGRKKYSEWMFVYTPPPGQPVFPGLPGQTGIPGRPQPQSPVPTRPGPPAR